MSKKITISIPTKTGSQQFYLSKTGLVSSIIIGSALLSATGVYVYSTQNHLKQLRADISAYRVKTELSQQQNLALLTENQTLETALSEQADEVHQLNQDLARKQDEIKVLGQRVFDVESVLGLTDESDEPTEHLLEARIDAAALDSAVRATLFRLIPNDSPINYNRISSSYGRRTNPITGKVHTHTGIDLTCNVGEPIYAPADGVIETVRPSKSGFGNFLTVRHAYGFMSSYAHLHRFKVRSGEFVAKGQQIATCGNSGNSTGPHLHYEVRFLGRSLNPQYTMDWTPDNFDYLFEKEKKVNWAPLVELVDNSVRMQVNLTNTPTTEESVDTASRGEEHTQDITMQ
ncbi:peptidoglycan DD-metalloendopeptidase family protein [Vibrio astriarenae]|uniref:peptidoglycan DD-metalloendopeptidase family protein n=1 Tax=Vibrio agarivorans TaxID=153622 RepID=UPI0025B5A0CC|nr:peptidoglycan DD-metalloendopeptidase family protein [Vibrio agarivorans]MDN3661507.1 peptidoglycan DD-metalloendopeptidase family protein [Vibrio agarivorans]